MPHAVRFLDEQGTAEVAVYLWKMYCNLFNYSIVRYAIFKYKSECR